MAKKVYKLIKRHLTVIYPKNTKTECDATGVVVNEYRQQQECVLRRTDLMLTVDMCSIILLCLISYKNMAIFSKIDWIVCTILFIYNIDMMLTLCFKNSNAQPVIRFSTHLTVFIMVILNILTSLLMFCNNIFHLDIHVIHQTLSHYILISCLVKVVCLLNMTCQCPTPHD
jgi:hypothetical protein